MAADSRLRASERCRALLLQRVAIIVALLRSAAAFVGDDRLSSADCACWAAQGQCESNPVFMRSNCARSCARTTEQLRCCATSDKKSRLVSELEDQLSHQIMLTKRAEERSKNSDAVLQRAEEQVDDARTKLRDSEAQRRDVSLALKSLEELHAKMKLDVSAQLTEKNEQIRKLTDQVATKDRELSAALISKITELEARAVHVQHLEQDAIKLETAVEDCNKHASLREDQFLKFRVRSTAAEDVAFKRIKGLTSELQTSTATFERKLAEESKKHEEHMHECHLALAQANTTSRDIALNLTSTHESLRDVEAALNSRIGDLNAQLQNGKATRDVLEQQLADQLKRERSMELEVQACKARVLDFEHDVSMLRERIDAAESDRRTAQLSLVQLAARHEDQSKSSMEALESSRSSLNTCSVKVDALERDMARARQREADFQRSALSQSSELASQVQKMNLSHQTLARSFAECRQEASEALTLQANETEARINDLELKIDELREKASSTERFASKRVSELVVRMQHMNRSADTMLMEMNRSCSEELAKQALAGTAMLNESSRKLLDLERDLVGARESAAAIENIAAKQIEQLGRELRNANDARKSALASACEEHDHKMKACETKNFEVGKLIEAKQNELDVAALNSSSCQKQLDALLKRLETKTQRASAASVRVWQRRVKVSMAKAAELNKHLARSRRARHKQEEEAQATAAICHETLQANEAQIRHLQQQLSVTSPRFASALGPQHLEDGVAEVTSGAHDRQQLNRNESSRRIRRMWTPLFVQNRLKACKASRRELQRQVIRFRTVEQVQLREDDRSPLNACQDAKPLADDGGVSGAVADSGRPMLEWTEQVVNIRSILVRHVLRVVAPCLAAVTLTAYATGYPSSLVVFAACFALAVVCIGFVVHGLALLFFLSLRTTGACLHGCCALFRQHSRGRGCRVHCEGQSDIAKLPSFPTSAEVIARRNEKEEESTAENEEEMYEDDLAAAQHFFIDADEVAEIEEDDDRDTDETKWSHAKSPASSTTAPASETDIQQFAAEASRLLKFEKRGAMHRERLVVQAVSRQLPPGLRICLLAGSNCAGECTNALVESLAAEFKRALFGSVTVITIGLEGIQEVFATSLGPSFPGLVHLRPVGHVTPSCFGQDVTVGALTEDYNMRVFGQIGHIYLTMGGGPAVARTASVALNRGALVLPLAFTGGASSGKFGFPTTAFDRPDFITDWQWMQLMESGPPRTVAVAVCSIISTALDRRKHRSPS
eukprot:TRINITY_DN48676_c0_g1_i1.p1 TRINITY_DN48676_c0_g1~~TRINITY_DN48676_c0_g1_i1.p1  ORF type:complete len:1252 (-),score=234.36 TRINITY_DN48676_c0_g1_i1:411-4166(-)